MAKKLVRKALEMLRKLASGEKEDGDDEDFKDGMKVKKEKSSDGSHPYIKFWEQVCIGFVLI